MVDLVTSDRRVGLAVAFTWLPAVSHEGVCRSRALTDAGPVRGIQPPGSVGGGTAERDADAGANFTI